MTGSQTNIDGPESRPISVAELLAKNGTIGAPVVTGRRRRRRGNSNAVTVAELTGEIPVITDADQPPEPEPAPTAPEPPSNGAAATVEPVVAAPAPDQEPEEDRGTTPYWSEPEPRWPHSAPQPRREHGPERSEYPRPLRRVGRTGAESTRQAGPRSGAEGMSPDPLDDYADIPVDVMDTDVREAEPATEDSAYVRSYLQGAEEHGDAPTEHTVLDDDYRDVEADLGGHREEDADESYAWSSRTEMLRYGGLIVVQSVLAVGFGAGLFIAFDQLWQWNNIVALVLAVLVILGLVAAVQVVRKTVDTASTLIAVAVGALIAFGPLALLQSG